MDRELSLREAYGETLVELGRENPDIVVLDADLSRSTMTLLFAEKFPGRFFDCGIAEQNMVSIAAGLAASGKIPFASTFAVFVPGRCFDQIRMSIAQPGLNVKLVVTHSGISVGEDGISHQSIEDLSLVGSFPGFTVIIPADAIETAQVIRAASAHLGPFYIRLCRPKLPLVYDQSYRFVLGKAVMMKSGRDATVIAIGSMVKAALEAAENLGREGIDCRILNMPTLKPIDEGAIVQAAAETGAWWPGQRCCPDSCPA
jgi:transketolase